MSGSTLERPPDLKQLSVTPPLLAYVRTLWHRREFAWAMSVGEMRARHMNTVLGGLWHVINPVLLLGVYWFVFGVILGTDRGVDNFVGFLAVGIFIWQFSQRSFIGGASSISSNLGLIRSLQFPRALLPLAAVMREAIALRAAVVVMVTIVLVSGWANPDFDEGVRWTWLLVPPILMLQFLFNLGGALVVARLADRIKDVANVLPFVFRLLFYLSGVLFLVDRFVPGIAARIGASEAAVKSLFVINPFYSFITLPREYMLSSLEQEHVGWMWLSVVCWSLVSLLVGLMFFRAGERGYGRG